MNPDKKIITAELLDRVNASPFVLVVDYAGTTVPQFNELRTRLAEGKAECHVAKNSYMKLVLSQAGLPDIGEGLSGQTAFVTGESDICATAKTLKNFHKEFDRPVPKVGILDGEILDEEQIKTLADLPAREVLLGQLLGVINAPAQKLLRTVNEPGTSLARIIQAKFPAP